MGLRSFVKSSCKKPLTGKFWKKLLKDAYRSACGLALPYLLATNFAMYYTLWRNYTTSPVMIRPGTNLHEVIQGADGDSLEDRINSVVKERIYFDREAYSAKFDRQLFGFLKKRVGDIRWQHLDLDEKIKYALMFSSELEYNFDANFIEYAMHSDKDGNFIRSLIRSSVEFYKINNMSVSEIADYKKVVCGQFAKVFAAALNRINDCSTNSEDLSVGRVWFVPDKDREYGGLFDVIVSASNALVFGEYRSSVGHVINIVSTDEKTYIIEPQWRAFDILDPPFLQPDVSLEIDNDYASKLK